MSYDINQTFIVEAVADNGSTMSACTALYTNSVISCSGNTKIILGNGTITFDGTIYTNDDLSANSISASTFYSGATNVFDIIEGFDITGGTYNNNTDSLSLYKNNGGSVTITGFTDYYTTGTTLIGNIVYFNRNDALSAYTLDLTSFSSDKYTTGVTFSDNQIIIARNDGVNLSTFINYFTGLTVNGLFIANTISATTISATTFYGDGSNLTGVLTQDTFVTGGTYSAGTAIFTNNTGGTFTVSGFNEQDLYITGGTFNKNSETLTLINNSGITINITGFTDVFVTGGTYSNGTLTLKNNSGTTFNINGFYTGSTDVFTTGATYNNANTLTFTNNTGGTFNVSFNTFTGLTTNTISATTYQNLPIDIRVTGGTYSAGTAIFTNNTGGTFTVSGLTTPFTGGTVSGVTTFLDVLNLSGSTNVYKDISIYNQNTLNTNFIDDGAIGGGGTRFNSSIVNVTNDLIVDGNFTATTINGNGSNISGINFSQLATTAHTHTISEVTNLQTNLNSKIDKPLSPYFGDYLYYNGITWVPNPINIPVSAGDGVTLFLATTGSTLMGYEFLSKFPTQTTEVQESVVVNNNQMLIHKYATEQLNRTVIDAGIWEFNTFASVDIPSTGTTQIIVSTFLLSTGGSETFLFSSATENITTTAATLYTFSLVEPQYSCTTTDYLVVKYSASTTNNFNTTVTLYYGGSLNYSHIHTPFITLHNDLAGIQGGLSNERYHLSKNETDLLTTGVDASSIHNHDSLYLGLGGGTVTGSTIFSSTLSASTYLGLPKDIFVTGGTYSNGTTTFTNNTGGTFNINGFYTGATDVFVTGSTYNNANTLTFTNNTGGTFNVLFNTFTGVTTNTISATTYQNLPIDIRVTGGTYSNGTAILTNNTGGTFNVTGFYTGATDIFTTGATYNNANTLTFTNNTGGTFNVLFNTFTGITSDTISATTYQNLPTDIRVTGGTFSNGTATFTNNTGGTFNVTGFFPGSQDIFTTGATYNNANTLTFTNNTGGTFNVLFNTVTGITVNGNATVTGNTSVNGNISGNTIFSTQSSGDEGGQIDLFKPQTNTTISGTSVSIDVYQNKVRIFESGGNSRGAYIDITDASTGLTNNLLGIVVYKNISPVTVSASTANTILQSIFIPANTFKAGDLIEASYRGKKVGTNNTAPFRLYANTALSLIGPTVISVTNFSPANNVYNSVFRTLQVVTSNNNTEVFGSATLANTDFANSTATVTNLSLDWTTDQYLFTASQPVSSLDSVTSAYLLLKRIR